MSVKEVTVWSWSDKTEAAKKYMLLGNMRLVSELTGISYNTLCDWRKQDWWTTLIDEIKAAQKAKRGNKMSQVIDESLEIIHDRIINGDFILNNKTGEIQRKPVSLRDVGNLANQLLTRQAQLEELSAKMEHSKETVQETLKTLAKEFAKWQRISATKDATDANIIENNVDEQPEKLEVIDAVQKQETTEMDVQEQTTDGKGVGEGDTEHQEASVQS